MNIHKSAEDYLEMILRLQETKGYVRAVDIASGLSVSKPSASVAMRNLRENGYITVDRDNCIHLAEPGMAIAREIYARHQFLTGFLIYIGVDAETAERDACRIEHDLSPSTFDAFKRFYAEHRSD